MLHSPKINEKKFKKPSLFLSFVTGVSEEFSVGADR